ncbi:MAG: S41 family peptidase [Bacteroidota bacterium]
MKISTLIYCLLFSFTLAIAQKADPVLNMGFEDMETDSELPNGWMQWGTPNFNLQVDSTVKKSGQQSMLITFKGTSTYNSFGCAAFKIPSAYGGKEITLEGYMKIENVEDGVAGLVLRVDGPDNIIGFDNMQDREINGTIDWKKYTTTVTFSSEATNIFVGGIVNGTGKAWFDDFQLFIDGVPLLDVPFYERPKLPAELDTEFDEGTNIKINELTAQQYESLYTLGKIWGFVKYYHPKIATGEVNWDNELFRVLPAVLNAKNKKEFSGITEKWINQLGKIEPNDSTNEVSDDIKLFPTTQWINDGEKFSPSLIILLNKINNAKRENKHFYIGHSFNVGNPIFKNEKAYENMAFDDDGFKLLSLYRYWNMIEYFFPYKHLTDTQWEKVLHGLIPRFLSADEELSYKLAALEMIGKVQDTHANIWRDSTLSDFHGENYVPMELTVVQDKVVITRFFNDSLQTEHGLEIGDVVLQIGEQSIAEAIEERSKYCPASNRPTQLRDVGRRLLCTNENTLELTLETNNGLQTLMLPTVPYDAGAFWQKDIGPWKIMDNNIGYIYPGSMEGIDVDAMMDSLKNTKGIVIDLRCYPSQFLVFTLGKYFVEQPAAFVKFTSGNLQTPGEFTFGDHLETGVEDNQNYYKNKVVVMVNATTQSQAEYTTMAFQSAPNVTVIGSTTAAADGNVSRLSLPGGIGTMISGIGVYYPDGRETQRVGIALDEEVKPTVQGIKAGWDEMLERAIEIIEQK